MELRQISSQEFGRLNKQLDTLPIDEAHGLRCVLAEKYYAYLDKLMQLQMAMREYDQAAEAAKVKVKI